MVGCLGVHPGRASPLLLLLLLTLLLTHAPREAHSQQAEGMARAQSTKPVATGGWGRSRTNSWSYADHLLKGFSTSAAHDFGSDAEVGHHAFVASADHTLGMVEAEGSDAHFLACTAYKNSAEALKSIREELGGSPKKVKLSLSSRKHGLTCFTLFAPFEYGRNLMAMPYTKKLTSAEVLPAPLKVSPLLQTLHSAEGSTAKHANTAKGLHVSMAPGSGGLPLAQGWGEAFVAAAADGTLRQTLYWASQDAQDQSQRSTHPMHSAKAIAWAQAVEHLHQTDQDGAPVAESCGWHEAELSSTNSGLVTVRGSKVLANLREAAQAKDHTQRACALGFVGFLAAQPSVEFIDLHLAASLDNFISASVVQTASPGGHYPMWDMNITGEGQVVGVVDSGLDDLSCYFEDASLGQVERSNVSNAVTDSSNRKVVQYIAFKDALDEYEGHGTHVVGTIAGQLEPSYNLTDYACDNDTMAKSCWGQCKLSTALQTRASDSEYDWELDCPAFGCDGDSAGTCVSDDDKEEVIPDQQGVAPGAKIAFLDAGNFDGTEFDLPETEDIFSYARDAGARIHSNSWSYDVYCTSYYGALGVAFDELVYDNPDMLLIFSAGNSGEDQDECTVTWPGHSKNLLTVGATEGGLSRAQDNIDEVASFSSRGWTYDGRVKPDVVAPGYYTLSASGSGSNPERSCEVHDKAGTSMACPAVSGAAALVRQYFTDGFHADDLQGAPSTQALCDAAEVTDTPYACEAFEPSAALIKATLINSGRHVYEGPMDDDEEEPYATDGPNVFEGHGRVTLNDTIPLGSDAFSLLAMDSSIGPDSEMLLTFRASDAGLALGVPLVLTLTWTDPTCSYYSTEPLMHDLDLLLVGPDGCNFTYSNGREGLDFWDSVEKIIVEEPVAGNYTVAVRSSELPENDTQTFALAASGPGEFFYYNASESGNFTCFEDFNVTEAVNEYLNGSTCLLVTGQLDACNATNLCLVGDGICQGGDYNTEGCLWDGGDCCPQTCTISTELCGYSGYDCKDPEWEDCSVTYPTFIGDGYCDGGVYNTEACGYEMGDCCRHCCEPVTYASYTCGSSPPSYSAYWDCQDRTCTFGGANPNPILNPDDDDDDVRDDDDSAASASTALPHTLTTALAVLVCAWAFGGV